MSSKGNGGLLTDAQFHQVQTQRIRPRSFLRVFPVFKEVVQTE